MNNVAAGLEVRHALPDDAPALSRLFDELGFPATAGEIAVRLEAMPHAALVAVRGSQVVGLLTTNIMPVLHRPTPVGRISALVVTRHERRRGTGRALVRAAEDLLMQQGCALIEVTSNFRFEEAHAFYRQLGYESTSLRFKKELNPA